MKILYKIFIIVSIILFAWFCLSYIDIIAHNLERYPVYQDWNFFSLFFE